MDAKKVGLKAEERFGLSVLAFCFKILELFVNVFVFEKVLFCFGETMLWGPCK
jgi:hypothetical protein